MLVVQYFKIVFKTWVSDKFHLLNPESQLQSLTLHIPLIVSKLTWSKVLVTGLWHLSGGSNYLLIDLFGFSDSSHVWSLLYYLNFTLHKISC